MNWREQTVPKIFEVRRLSELSARLDERPHSLALVEVVQSNLADVLPLMASAERLHPNMRFAALVDRELPQVVDVKQLADVLREAGAQEVLISPRQLEGILAIGRLFAQSRPLGRSDSAPDESIVARVWDSLPWQGD